MYIDKLANILNEYNNIYHTTWYKIKPIYVKSSSYIDFGVENRKYDRGPKFKVADHVRLWKYKNMFEKGYDQNWSEE